MSQKGFIPILLLIGILTLVLAIGGVYFLGNRKNQPFNSKVGQQVPKPDTSTYKESSNSKTYSSDFYRFQIDIPEDWVINESVRPDGYPSVQLISPNGDIVIENPLNPNVGGTYVVQDLDQPPVQLGNYTAPRTRYLTTGNRIIDYVQLSNVPQYGRADFDFIINGDFDKNNAILLKILETFSFTKPLPLLIDFFTYQLPSGWKKLNNSQQEEQYLVYVSPDYKTDEHDGYRISGVNIVVNRSIKDPSKTILEIINQSPRGASDKENPQPVKIDGLEGLMVHSDWESHALAYFVPKDIYLWTFVAHTTNLNDENKYRQGIDSFINSIKFN